MKINLVAPSTKGKDLRYSRITKRVNNIYSDISCASSIQTYSISSNKFF